MGSEYDFAKLGRPLNGYTRETVLGYQAIKPLAIDALSDHLRAYNLSWTYVPFAKANTDLIPAAGGVYHFLVQPRAANIERHAVILYVGRARNLQARFRDYLVERQGIKESTRRKVVDMLTIYFNRIEFAYAVTDYYQTERIEDYLIHAIDPCCNERKSRPIPAFTTTEEE